MQCHEALQYYSDVILARNHYDGNVVPTVQIVCISLHTTSHSRQEHTSRSKQHKADSAKRYRWVNRILLAAVEVDTTSLAVLKFITAMLKTAPAKTIHDTI